MEGTFTPVHEQSRDRKSSYKNARSVNAVDDQAKAAKSENASTISNDPVDVFISSDDSSGSGKAFTANSVIDFTHSYKLRNF